MRDVRILLAAAMLSATAARPDDRSTLGDRAMRLTRDSVWSPVASIPVAFRTYHPQGMLKVGDAFFVSSVEVTVPTRRTSDSVGRYDRDAGKGVGHLFKIDRAGSLIAHIVLGEGSIYHPGGLDYDGQAIWVPVAEYRPNSRSVIYRVDPVTMKAVEAFRFPDHIGALAVDADERTLHGVSWGSRRFYRWTIGRDGRVLNAGAPPGSLRTVNPSHYVDYQDCKYAGQHRMLCSGVTEIRRAEETTPFRLGGIDLVDLRDGRPLHQTPVLLWTPSGLAMTQNPVWLEPSGSGLSAYFMPEDDRSTIYVYEVAVP